jgi:hypothetical protein
MSAKAPKLAAERPILTNRAAFVSAAITFFASGATLSWRGAEAPSVELPPLVAAEVQHPLSLGLGLLGAGLFLLLLARLRPGGRLGRNLRRLGLAVSSGLPAAAALLVVSTPIVFSQAHAGARRAPPSVATVASASIDAAPVRLDPPARTAFLAFVAAFERGNASEAVVHLERVLELGSTLSPDTLHELRDGVTAPLWTRVLAGDGTLAAEARAFLTLAAADEVKVATKLESARKIVVYVLDVSESMAGDPAPYVAPDGSVLVGSRLDRAKAVLVRSLMSLPRDWSFNLETLDGRDWWQKEPRLADDADRSAAIGWIATLGARQGSAGNGVALALVAAGRKDQLLVLITDGAAAGDKAPDRDEIARSNVQGGTVNVVGVGATPAAAELCRAIASVNGGGYALIR